MSVRENIEAKAEALASLKRHCLCLNVVAGLVYLPNGYKYDAIHVPETAKGYRLAEAKLEQIWKESLWWKR